MGASFLRGFVINFDAQRHKIGFAPFDPLNAPTYPFEKIPTAPPSGSSSFNFLTLLALLILIPIIAGLAFGYYWYKKKKKSNADMEAFENYTVI